MIKLGKSCGDPLFSFYPWMQHTLRYTQANIQRRDNIPRPSSGYFGENFTIFFMKNQQKTINTNTFSSSHSLHKCQDQRTGSVCDKRTVDYIQIRFLLYRKHLFLMYPFFRSQRVTKCILKPISQKIVRRPILFWCFFIVGLFGI